MKSIYDLIKVVELESGEAQLEDIKTAVEIYNELSSSSVSSLLSFHGGIQLSNILNKLQNAIMDRGGIEEENEEEVESSLDDLLSDEEKSFLYGIYLLS